MFNGQNEIPDLFFLQYPFNGDHSLFNTCHSANADRQRPFTFGLSLAGSHVCGFDRSEYALKSVQYPGNGTVEYGH